jgi:hypothetical protein
VTTRYKSPEAFRTALEQRQKQRAAADGVPFDRVAQIDMYYRFLARVVRELGDGAVVVKGGVALEMRLQRARTTLDIDLRAQGVPAQTCARIRLAGQRDLGDFLTFVVDDKPDGEIEGKVIYEGRRFSVQAMLANRPYRNRFGLDVAFGDPMVGLPDQMLAPDALAFVGVAPPTIPLYPIATHLAEKLHAYTLRHADDRPNSRLKDLVDIALVATEPALQPASTMIMASTVRRAMVQTFAARATHPLPSVVPQPPPAWSARYLRERRIHGLSWANIDEVRAEAAGFLDPVLRDIAISATGAIGAWDPRARHWSLELAILRSLPGSRDVMSFPALVSVLGAEVGAVVPVVERLAASGDPLVDIIAADVDGIPIELRLTGRGRDRVRR